MYKTLGNCKEFRLPPPITDANHIVIEEVQCENMNDPKIWGSAWWFSLFNGCCSADEIIPKAYRMKYWKFIEGLPFMLPCKKCSVHAEDFVEKHKQYRDEICSSRRNLLKFFVNFYNSVSKRKGGEQITIKDIERKFLRGKPAHAIKVRYI